MMVEYRTVSIPKRLADKVAKFMEEVGFWPSLSAFAREAVIEKLLREREMRRAADEELPPDPVYGEMGYFDEKKPKTEEAEE